MSAASIQSQILAAVVQLLSGAAGAKSWRSRMTAFRPDELPAINVLPEEGDTEYTTVSCVDRRFRFKVRFTTSAIDECDAAIDPVYVAGSQQLMADAKLGGLVLWTRELAQKWEMEKGELDTVALVVTYECEFSTTRSDPSVSWP